MATWGPTFKDQPPNAQSPSLGAERIRESRTAVEARIANEHRTHLDGTSGVANLDGVHKRGSAAVYVSDSHPTTFPNGDALTAVADGKLWYKSDTKQLHVYVHAAGIDASERWVPVQMAGLQEIASLVFEGDVDFQGAVQFAGGIILPVLATAPVSPVNGQIWLLEV